MCFFFFLSVSYSQKMTSTWSLLPGAMPVFFFYVKVESSCHVIMCSALLRVLRVCCSVVDSAAGVSGWLRLRKGRKARKASWREHKSARRISFFGAEQMIG